MPTRVLKITTALPRHAENDLKIKKAPIKIDLRGVVKAQIKSAVTMDDYGSDHSSES